MSASILYEVRLAVSSLVTGAGLMVVYDLICAFRIFCPHSDLAVGAEDLGYGVYCAVITFGLLYEQNNGTLRAYAIAGTIAGMAVYQRVIGSIFIKYLKKLRKYLRMRIKLYRWRKKQVER